MFATLARSWEFAKISYGIIWDFKRLLVFPLVSTLASGVVLASFLLPLWGTGTLEAWLEFADGNTATQASAADQVWMYLTLFLFYFCSYFVITFFNSGLVACAMKVVNGEVPTVGYGMSMAANKVKGVRAALCLSSEAASLARRHNDANVLTLAGWQSGGKEVLDILSVFVTTEFEGGRHARRVNKITAYEERSDES